MPSHKQLKKAVFLGNSLRSIKSFPETAISRIGYEIHRLQCGDSPTNYRPVKEVGAGVFEIRTDVANSWFRAFYVVKFKQAVFILHAFEKKQNKTPKKDIEIARASLKILLQRYKGQNRND